MKHCCTCNAPLTERFIFFCHECRQARCTDCAAGQYHGCRSGWDRATVDQAIRELAHFGCDPEAVATASPAKPEPPHREFMARVGALYRAKGAPPA